MSGQRTGSNRSTRSIHLGATAEKSSAEVVKENILQWRIEFEEELQSLILKRKSNRNVIKPDSENIRVPFTHPNTILGSLSFWQLLSRKKVSAKQTQ